MVPQSRRSVLAALGTAALAGCLASDDDPEEAPSRSELDDAAVTDDLATVLSAIPDQVGEHGVETVRVVAPEPAEDETAARSGIAGGNPLGVDPSSVDRVATAQFGGLSRGLVVASGSFAADDVAPDGALGGGSDGGAGSDSGVGGSADAAGSDGASADASGSGSASSGATASSSASSDGTDDAVYAEDGFAVLASANGDEPWDGGLEAATVARDDQDLGLLARAPVDALLEPITGSSQLYLFPEFPPEELSLDVDVDLSDVEAAATTQEPVDVTTRETTIVLLFSSADAVDRGVVDDLIESGGTDVDADDATVEEDGRRVVVTLREPRPEHQLPDDSPDLFAHVANVEGAPLELQFDGAGSADPANLELRVDDEPADDPPWAGTSAVGGDQRYELDVPRFSRVEVVWIDPEREGVEHTLGEGTHAPRDLFEGSYDEDAQRLVVTYVGDDVIDPGRFEVEHSERDDAPADPTPLDEYVDELTGGETIAVEDVAYGDHVRIQVAREDQSYGAQVFGFFAPIPGRFELVRGDGETFLAFRGDSPQAAENYRIRIEGEAAATQFVDEYDTLTAGDRVRLDAEFGDSVAVRWTDADEPLDVRSFQVRPDATFEFDFRDDTDAVEITHAGGDALDSDDLAVRVHQPERDAESRPEERSPWSGDQVTEGDSAVVDLPDGTESVVTVGYDGRHLAHDYPGEEPPEA